MKKGFQSLILIAVLALSSEIACDFLRFTLIETELASEQENPISDDDDTSKDSETDEEENLKKGIVTISEWFSFQFVDEKSQKNNCTYLANFKENTLSEPPYSPPEQL